jgi:hypothetical protein
MLPGYLSAMQRSQSTSRNEDPKIHVVRQDMRRFLYNTSDDHIYRLAYRKVVVHGRQAEMSRFMITDLPPKTCMRIECVLPSHGPLTIWQLRRIDWRGRAPFRGLIEVIESRGFGDVNPNMVDTTVVPVD